MSAVTEHLRRSPSPLDRNTESAASMSSAEELPEPKLSTQTFRAIAHTPPSWLHLLGPESAVQVLQSSFDEKAEQSGNDGGELDHDGPPGLVDAGTPPLLADVDAVFTSSIISSHEASFCNSLIVTRGERQEQERTPSAVPHRALAHRRGGSFLVDAPTHTNAEQGGGDSGVDDSGDEKGNSGGDKDATPASSSAAPSSHNQQLSTHMADNLNVSTHSLTSARSRLRHRPVTPAGDVRTLHDLMMWRSHLPDSQRSSDLHRDHDPPAEGSPLNKSVPAPLRGGSGNDPLHFPASSLVTPDVWNPVLLVRANLPATFSPPVLFGPTAASASSATTAPASEYESCCDVNDDDNIAGRRRTSPFSSYPSVHPPPRLSSNYGSRSDLEDSFSSTSTSHITSPATALLAHHLLSSPYDSRSRISGDHGVNGGGGGGSAGGHLPGRSVASSIFITPVTTRGVTVLDTRHAAPSSGRSSSSYTTQNTNPAHSSNMERRDSQILSKIRAGAAPASPAPSTGSGWAIEDHAPPHARSVGSSHLPALSPLHHKLPSRGSDASSSPRSALLGFYSPSVSHDFLCGSHASKGGGGGGGDSSSQGSHSGTVGQPTRRMSSSIFTTPALASVKGGHESTMRRRGLKVPEEYPSFATPVDDDTNKAVVAFVTALLLLFCLGLIFTM
ncbi:hypothetical protein ABB37_05873 [Leptomonas pyrrhocoris]|uniref:Uncharacterized protein n=1 Tax=Leptomonas pyrrhocoris TaxID=157538 RepID=A0A0N1J4P2_LEPPY|nr:hypothetical protein ABB37_05873 [Leptomonas pyrrhocoris]KPA78758.1 hypothetical protein ABB37_05873 [Leptomonas pyrrhocoris]|eukprot:XP_015657197.1 hypothetical protein ABB37_05873 [Leptomonas pyrrhocoris]